MMTLERRDATPKQLTTRQRVIVAIHQWRAKPENMGRTLTAAEIGEMIGVAASTVFDARGALEEEKLIEPNPTGRHGGWRLTELGIQAACALSVETP